MLINGSCSGSMIHPGLFEIIFTSLTLPPCTKAIQIADSPGNFQGIYRPGGGGGGHSRALGCANFEGGAVA